MSVRLAGAWKNGPGRTDAGCAAQIFWRKILRPVKKTSFYIISVLLLVSLGVLPFFDESVLRVTAEGARILVSPEAGSFSVGKTFTMRVSVENTGGVGINAAEATINFDPSVLSVLSIGRDNSIFSLWAVEPAFSNAAGTVTFGGGSTVAKNSGQVISVVFSVKKEGRTDISIIGASVLAADGKGTNVLTGVGKASYILTASGTATPPVSGGKTPPPSGPVAPAPEVNSPTHPEEEKWYSNNAPEFKWALFPSITDIMATLSDKPTGDPGNKSVGLVESVAFPDTPDGLWYFHARFRNQNGWSKIVHRKVSVDTTPPDGFGFEVQRGDPTDPQPVLVFSNATDTASGLDHYEIKVDSATAVVLKLEDARDNRYQLTAQPPGNHKIIARMVDKAGNAAESVQDISIREIEAPKVIKFQEKIHQGRPIIIEGSAIADATVLVRLIREGEDREEIQSRMITDGSGNWLYANQNALTLGMYKISAKTIHRNKAESVFSSDLVMQVVAPPFMERYGLAVYVLIGIIITALAAMLFYERRAFLRERELVKKFAASMKDKVGKIFGALREEVQEKISYLEAQVKAGEGEVQTAQVMEKLNEALDISENIVSKDIEGIEKTLE